MGKRGEGWFLLQLVLFALIALTPQVGPPSWPAWVRAIGVFVLAAGGVFGTGGVLALGRNLSPFLKPIEGGRLVESGVYRFVRHPIYSGLVLGTLGWAIWNGNLLGIGLSVALLILFDIKSRREETWLLKAYPDYADYRARVRKFFPGIY